MKTRHVITAFLRRDGCILLVRRSEHVGTYQGKWSGISGFLETDPLQQAYTELREETGVSPSDVTLASTASPLEVPDRDRDTCWVVHPFLFDLAPDGKIALDWENTEHRWTAPEEVGALPTVPKLDAALQVCLRAEQER